jgi:hydroxyethylthiazole kinase-like uncharacterized protein yjeF
MRLVTGEAMARIDRHAIEGRGIPGLDLMERAGEGVVRAIEAAWGARLGRFSVGIVCGKGNNGGDGFVVGRLLANRDVPVVHYLLGSPDDVSGDAAMNLQKVERMDLPIRAVESVSDLGDLGSHGLLVDAIFGTGFSGAPRGVAAEVIERINAIGRPVVAVDVPSGVSVNDGSADGVNIEACLTVTMALPKRGHLYHPGRERCGATCVVDIGIPDECAEQEDVGLSVLVESEAAAFLPRFVGNAHKGDCGRAFLLAGSQGLTGAAALAGEGCARAGAGLVVVGCPSGVNDVLEAKLTEVMTRPLPDNRRRRALSRLAFSPALEGMRASDAVAIGPGLSTYHQVRDLVRQLVPRLPCPTVIDADGLNALAGAVDLVSDSPSPVVLTPHPGEYARLFETSIPEIAADPEGAVRRAVERTGAVVVLKGAPTVIGSPDCRVYVNPTGNSGMASGGTGDVLTGIITGFLAQGLSAFDAAVLGVYVHGAAGDRAARRLGRHGTLAGDLLTESRSGLSFVQPFDAEAFRRQHPMNRREG